MFPEKDSDQRKQELIILDDPLQVDPKEPKQEDTNIQ